MDTATSLLKQTVVLHFFVTALPLSSKNTDTRTVPPSSCLVTQNIRPNNVYSNHQKVVIGSVVKPWREDSTKLPPYLI